MSKEKLLNYVVKNYDNIVVEAQGGPYIAIDLIPNGDDNKLHTLPELIESCDELDFDITMITNNGYTPKIGDGIRECRYFYFMQETTKEILNDLN